jgi:histidinol-phosphate aminotransferase
MSRFWSKVVQGLTPYTPGEQPKVDHLVKLNTNENPYPPSPKVIDAIQSAVGDGLRLYPDPNAQVLKDTLAGYHQVESNQVFVGNSSDEVLAHVFHALLKQDLPLLFPDITYSFYPVYCGLYEIDYRTVPLRDDFSIAIEDYDQPCSAIIFPNPNAPTGRVLALEKIELLLQRYPDRLLVVDEAYVDFGGVSAVRLVNQYDNLLVVQTLSKSRSLAGLRVGFAIGHAGLIEALERVKNSFNSYPLDRLAIAGAVAAYEDEAYFVQTRDWVIAERIKLTSAFEGMGFEVVPSAANFIFTTHPHYDAADLAARLRTHKVIVRHFKLPRIDQYLRISVGNEAQNLALLTAMHQILDDLNREKSS